MSSSPALPDPADRARQRDEDAQYYRQVLHELVEIGSHLARAIDRHAAPAPASAPAPELSIAFPCAIPARPDQHRPPSTLIRLPGHHGPEAGLSSLQRGWHNTNGDKL